MKRNFTAHYALGLQAGNKLLLTFVAVLFSWSLFGQTLTPAQEIGDLSEVKWKDTPSLTPVLAIEQSRMDVALSPASVAADEAALYHAYKRLLTYLQSDIQSGMSVDKSILDAYEKVLSDAIADPELKNMPNGHLATYIPGLVEMLTEPIKATPAN